MSGPDGDAAAGLDRVGRGPRRPAAVRPDLALVARPPRRRAASRVAAPHRALADAGTGARGGGADRADRARDGCRSSGARLEAGAAGRGHRDRSRRPAQKLPLHRTGPGRARRSCRRPARRLAGQRRRARSAYAAAGAANPPEIADLRATATRLAPIWRAIRAAASIGSTRRPAAAGRCAGPSPAARPSAGGWIGLRAGTITWSPASRPSRCCRPGWRCR